VLREQVVGPTSVLGAAERAKLETSLRATMARTEFVMATARGRLLTLSQALSLAHDILELPESMTGPASD
jgi:hypothetical protein